MLTYQERQKVAEFVSVSVGAKEMFARLLASENLRIEHSPKFTTAAFDVRQRVLYLPVWPDMSNEIYNLFVAHEVGHALYTPDGDHFEKWSEGLRSYVNVVEDARIETRQKRKFPGLQKHFREGYVQLRDRGFFGDLSDIGSMSLGNRINLKAKLGIAIDVPFTPDEQKWFDRVMAVRSFEDAVQVATELWELERENVQNPHPEMGQGEAGDGSPDESDDSGKSESKSKSEDSDESDESDSTGDASDSDESETDGASPNSVGDSDADSDESDASGSKSGSESDASGSESEKDEGDSDSDSMSGSTSADSKSSPDSNASGVSKNSDPSVSTYDHFREMEKTLADTNAAIGIEYKDAIKLSGIDQSAFIIPSKLVAPTVVSYFEKQIVASAQDYSKRLNPKSDADTWTRQMQDRAKRPVSLLAKEFEMRKAADASKRAFESNTGVIDTNKLHSYKWNDHIFKRNTTTPDGKSHGLVMFVDWSGSMQMRMPGAIDQIFKLILFCERVGIPYDVYAFSSVVPKSYDYMDSLFGSKDLYDYTKNMKPRSQVTMSRERTNLTLIQLASSSDSKRVRVASRRMLAIIREIYEDHCRNWRKMRGYSLSNVPGFIQLGMTPLHETTLVAANIVNEFQSKHGVQIVNAVFVTDGGGHGIFHGSGRDASTVIRDPETRKEYLLDKYGYRDSTGGMHECAIVNDMLRSRTGANVINFYIAEGHTARGARQVLENYIKDRDWIDSKYGDALKEFPKTGGFAVAKDDMVLGYDYQFVIMGDSVDENDLTLTTNSNMTDAKLRKEFIKTAKKGQMARKVLSEFASIIAG